MSGVLSELHCLRFNEQKQTYRQLYIPIEVVIDSLTVSTSLRSHTLIFRTHLSSSSSTTYNIYIYRERRRLEISPSNEVLFSTVVLKIGTGFESRATTSL